MKDKQLGISIRFIRQYDIKADTDPRSFSWDAREMAFQLALGDDRDVPFLQKMADALTYIRSQVN